MASGGVSGSSSAFRGSGYSQQRQPSYMTQASSSSSVTGETFTPQMRDRQARGKDPYHSGEGSDASDLSDRDTSTASRLRLGSSRYVSLPPHYSRSLHLIYIPTYILKP